MKKIIEELNRKANNLEETCCGISNFWEEYENRKNREKLIEEIDNDLELFVEALTELKAIK